MNYGAGPRHIKRGEMKKTIVILLCALVVFCGDVLAEPNRSSQTDYWPNGKPEQTKFFDQNGDLRQVRYFRQDGTLEQVESYDVLGHKVAIGYYENNGQLRDGIDGWAAMRMLYKGGNMVAEGYYGPDGKLMERKIYNSEGDLVDKQYIGGSDNLPAEEYNPQPALAGEGVQYYDKYGRKEMSTYAGYDDFWFPDEWTLDEWD